MPANSIPVLPHPSRINGEQSIPPPPAEDFKTLFGHVLPPPQTIKSYWGDTTYYLFEPCPSDSPRTEPPRRVLLIHGVGTPAIGLLPLAARLAASSTPTTVVIYDIWGHGLSSTPVAAHVSGLFHSQILHLLSHLQWTSAHFLGYSLGGMIAATFARYHAPVVKSLVLVAPAGLWKKSSRSVWERFMGWGGWGWGWESYSARRVYGILGPGPVPEGWEKEFADKGMDAVPREAVQVWEYEKHAGHVASMASCYRYSGLYDSHDTFRALANTDLATLTLLGEHDAFFQVEYMTNELQSLGWKGKIQVIAGVGHGVIAEKTEEVEKSMLEFWKSLEAI